VKRTQRKAGHAKTYHQGNVADFNVTKSPFAKQLYFGGDTLHGVFFLLWLNRLFLVGGLYVRFFGFGFGHGERKSIVLRNCQRRGPGGSSKEVKLSLLRTDFTDYYDPKM
jgi:hypothetical protein